MGIDRHCRWVRHRLPLLVGGELRIDERRKVERHLIGCLDCRGHRASSTDAFSALRAFAEVSSPARSDAPSLWPALSDQIRQSKHVPRPLSWWETPLPRAWSALSLAMGLIGMVIAPLALLSGREPERPSPPISAQRETSPVASPKLVVTPPTALPSGGSILVGDASKNFAGSGSASTASAPSFNYDLDHGTPMGPGNRDPQRSY
jgi:anti-sigma factor RsiW